SDVCSAVLPVRARQATPVPSLYLGVVNSRGIDYNGSIVFHPLGNEVDAYLTSGEDGKVTLKTSKMEFGQGIRTGFMQIVAEELDVNVEDVIVDMGQTDVAAPEIGTFGSLSTQMSGPVFRQDPKSVVQGENVDTRVNR